WRWVFYVNLPVGAVALVVTSTRLKLPRRERSTRPVDYLGAALLAGGATALILLTNWGGNQYAWNSGVIIGLGVAGALMPVLFILQERRAEGPVIPPSPFRPGPVGGAGAASVPGGVRQFAAPCP